MSVRGAALCASAPLFPCSSTTLLPCSSYEWNHIHRMLMERNIQKQPQAPRSTQEHPGAAKSSQEQPGPPRSTQKQPGAPRSTRKQPRATRDPGVVQKQARSTHEQPGTQDPSGTALAALLSITTIQDHSGAPRNTQNHPGTPRARKAQAQETPNQDFYTF